MLAMLLALGASLSWGTSDFLGGLKSRSLPLLTVLLASQATSLVLLAGIVAVAGQAPPGPGYLFAAAIAGLGETLGVAALYRGLGTGRMSIVAPVSSAAPAVPVVVGVALGEAPAPIQSVGLVLIVAGVVGTAAHPRSTSPSPSPAGPSVLYGLLSAVGFGAFFVAMDSASEGSLPWALLVARLTAVTALVAAALVTRSRVVTGLSDIPILAAIGILIVGADAMYAAATTVGSLAVVAVLSALHPLVTIGLARTLLHERITRTQTAGIAACVAGVLAITAT